MANKKQSAASNNAVKSNVLKVIALEEKAKKERTLGEKISEYIAAFCGSMIFVYVHVIWFGGWILLNSLAGYNFDPFPFTFLTLVVSLEAIFLSTFILISQNHETQLSDKRNHLDLQINMLSEQESTRTLELVQLIAKKVGVKVDDSGVDDLLEPLDPQKLIREISKASKDVK